MQIKFGHTFIFNRPMLQKSECFVYNPDRTKTNQADALKQQLKSYWPCCTTENLILVGPRDSAHPCSGDDFVRQKIADLGIKNWVAAPSQEFHNTGIL